MTSQEQYNNVINSLKLMAATFDEQKKVLPEFSDVPDDVTSSFENSFLLLPQLIEQGKFSNYSIALLLRTYNKMQWCLRNTDLDNFSNEEWNKLRMFARHTLATIVGP